MRILILGISVRAMVESAVRSNYQAAALDAFGDRDLSAIAESHSLHHDFHVRYSPNALFEASRQLESDAIAYTSNLENHPEILRRFAENRRIIGNSPETVEAVRCWAALFPRLRKAGFSVPETISPGNGFSPDPSRQWLAKPVLSGGGHDIMFFQREKLSGRDFMLQEFITGKPCSASFVANGRDCVLVAVTEQLIGLRAFGAQGFRYCGNVLPARDAGSLSILEQVRRLAEFLTQEYGLTGVNGFDFILHGDQVMLTEINPRYSASMELVERAYGLPIFHIHAKAALDGKLPDFTLESVLDGGMCYGKAVLFAEKDATAPGTQDWIGRGIKDVPASGERLREGGPVCTILAKGMTFDDTVASLIGQSDALKEEIYV
jgi:uncharacterized protein